MSSNANTNRLVAKQATKKQLGTTRAVPNTITRAIGDALRVQRKHKGLTQLSVAMNAEVERTRISKLELGLVNPSVLSLASICHVLGITLADLFANIRLSHPPTVQGGGLRRANQAMLDKPAKSRRNTKTIASSSKMSVQR